MPSSKITQLPLITTINANTSNTLFVGVDVPTLSTGQLTVHTLAQGLYSNEILNVGQNQQNLPNTVAQFSSNGASYVQTNLVNTNDGGSADIVVTANTGSDSTYFIDMGYANKNYRPGINFNDIGTAVNPLDGYIYAQGVNSSVPGGNLIVGSTTSGREVRFVAGGGSSSNVIAKMTANGFYMMNGMAVYFSDGVAQYNAAASLAYTQAAYALSNTTSATVTYQTGVNATQNTNIQSAWNLANTSVQNTAIITINNLNVVGNIAAAGIQSTIGAITTGNLIVNGTANVSGTLNVAGIISGTGYIQPQKGFVYTPTVYPNSQTAITIDFTNNSLVRAQTATGLTVTLSNLLAGKEVVAWITNTSGTNQTFTHGVSTTNSTTNATNYSIPGTSTILARYISIDGTLANTLVAVTHA
jgi:hypothetical protein